MNVSELSAFIAVTHNGAIIHKALDTLISCAETGSLYLYNKNTEESIKITPDTDFVFMQFSNN